MSRQPKPKPVVLLPSGVHSDALEDALTVMLYDYERAGRHETFVKALAKARAYLKKWPAPYSLAHISRGRWFVGESENSARIARGEKPIGYHCLPDYGRCGCFLFDPWKVGKKLPTCKHIETVQLYLKARELDEVYRAIQPA